MDLPEPEGSEDDRRLLARDGKGVPLLSARDWTEEAMVRIFRVPAGFMRDKTQERVERLAAERGADTVGLDLVEEGVAIGLRMMEEALAETEAPATKSAPAPAESESPQNGAATGKCPFSQAMEGGRADAVREVIADYPLKEVSVMTEMERKRREMQEN